MTDLNSTEKVLKILKAFLPGDKPRGNLELSRMTGIHPASVNRILSILKLEGFVQQESIAKLYKLGPALAVFGHAIRRSSIDHLRNIADPHLRSLREKVQESVGLSVLTEEGLLEPIQLRGPQPVSVAFGNGTRMAMNCNAGAKAVLAFLHEDQLQNIVNANLKLPIFTSNTLASWDQLTAQFEKIRQTGFAYDIEEFNRDVMSVGAPVLNAAHHPVCAVTIVVPSLRSTVISDPDVLMSLGQAAKAISLEINS